MAEEPGANASNLPDEDAKPKRTEKVVQMSCRMPNCGSKQHYDCTPKGAPHRVYECVECANVWTANVGGSPGF